mgnify:CR=1 FL=1
MHNTQASTHPLEYELPIAAEYLVVSHVEDNAKDDTKYDGDEKPYPCSYPDCSSQG